MKVKTLTEKVEAMICKGFFVQNVDCTKRSYNHSVESYRHDFCRKDVYIGWQILHSSNLNLLYYLLSIYKIAVCFK
jgi:hypothetical protein